MYLRVQPGADEDSQISDLRHQIAHRENQLQEIRETLPRESGYTLESRNISSCSISPVVLNPHESAIYCITEVWATYIITCRSHHYMPKILGLPMSRQDWSGFIIYYYYWCLIFTEILYKGQNITGHFWETAPYCQCAEYVFLVHYCILVVFAKVIKY